MMTIKQFILYVELLTKVASVFPFLIGTLYAAYHFKTVDLINMVLMFSSLICFDMCTTAINNYIDAMKIHNQNPDQNPLEAYGLNKVKAKGIIFILLALATLFGLILLSRTNSVVGLIGAISFLVGIFYTFGPIPLSRMPLGEIFSGFFMGFVIPFLAAYIHVWDRGIVTFTMTGSEVSFSFSVIEVVKLMIMAVPLMMGIANIMLANNICDLEQDIQNKRFTLPYYIGKKQALGLFGNLYWIGYATIILGVFLGILPLVSLIVIFTVPIVYKHVTLFKARAVKSETFVLAVKNFLMISGTYSLALIIQNIFN